MKFCFKKISQHGGASPDMGTKPPVFTELVATENGTYENPTIEGEPVLAVGEKVTFKNNIVLGVDIPADILSNYGNSQYFYTGQYVSDDGKSLIVEESQLYSEMDDEYNIRGIRIHICMYGNILDGTDNNHDYYYFDQFAADKAGVTDGAGWYLKYNNSSTITKIDTPPYFYISEASDFGAGELLLPMKGAFQGPSTPADGWNKVTINTPGDIIDVAELPTENVDSNKVYRVSGEEFVEGCFFNAGGEYISINLPNEGYWGTESVYKYIYHIVDDVPSISEMICTSPYDAYGYTDENPYPMHIYVVRSTGVMYNNENDSDIVETSLYGPGECIAGVVSDVSEIPEDGGWYTVIKKNTVYGIPENVTVKKLVDGIWVELS